MAAVMIQAKQLDDISECPICQDSYTDPRSLPCLHTFCFECIRTWFREKRPMDQVNCPLCRAPFRIPSLGLEKLAKNFFVSKVLAIKESSSSTTRSRVCDRSAVDGRLPSERANLSGPDCGEFSCDSCSSLRTVMPTTRRCNTQSVEEKITCNDRANNCLLTIRCDEHPDKYLELYCSDCQETVCMVCFVTRHRGHKPTDIKEFVNDVKAELMSDVSLLADDGKGRLVRYLKALHDRRIDIDDQAKDTEVAICEKAERLKKMINHQKDQLLLEVNQLKDNKVKAIQKTLGDVTQSKEMIAYLTKYGQELLLKGSYCDIARDSELLTRRADELVRSCEYYSVFNTPGQLITFTPAFIPAEVSNNMIGEVKDLDTQTFTRSLAVDNSITALALLDCLLFIAHASENDNVSVYDTATFRRVRLVTIADCIPYGLAACSTYSCLYLSGDSNKIHTVSLSTYVVASSWSTPHRPRGLSVTRSHHLLVAYAGSDKIHELSHTGALLRELSVGSEVWQVVELNNGKLVASTTGPFHGVCLISADGKVLGRFGSLSPGCKAEQMKCPRCVAVDKQGYVVVADYMNNRVLVLNPALSDKRVFRMSDGGVCKPVGLWFDESRGRLYVGECVGNSSRLLAFDNVFNLGNTFS